MINWLSMLAANRVFFNSRHHQEEWFDELPRLLKHFPDHTHVHRIDETRARSSVLPVGCDLSSLDSARQTSRFSDPPLILWNQRWEYDKDPETFFRALYALADEGLPFRVALAGSNVRQMPLEFKAARKNLGERVFHYGRASRSEYAQLLWQADIVVSTALHEFFGVAIVEAIHCGCLPILPRRLAYPEIIPTPLHEACLYDDFEGLLERMRGALTQAGEARRLASEFAPTMSRFDWGELAPAYDTVMAEVERSARA
jgi:glycosyltransferase involved in cell wall biosynthesis